MFSKKILAAVLSVSCMITSLTLPAQAETKFEVTAEFTVPTLPENIRLSDLKRAEQSDKADNNSDSPDKETDYTLNTLHSIDHKWIKDENGSLKYVWLTAEERVLLEQAADAIIANVDNSWNDLQKVTYVHDYLASTKCYDLTYSKYSAYDILVTGTAVCQGYAEAFWYLMYKLGIDCKMVSSETLNHAWNIVMVNGKWYQIDVTWDDPITDVPGRSVHTYFLLSDTQFRSVKNGKHNADDFVLSDEALLPAYGYCTDTTYDEGWFWTDSQTPGYLVNGYFYNLNGTYLTRNDCENNSVKLLDLKALWHVVGNDNSSWSGFFSGLQFDGNKFYYHDEKTLYSCNPNGENITAEYVMTDEEYAQSRIYGIVYSDGKITMRFAEKPYDKVYTEKTVAIESSLSYVRAQAYYVSYEDSTLFSCYMNIPDDIAQDSTANMHFSVAGKSMTFPVSSAETDVYQGKKVYVFNVPVAAAEMADTISFYLTYGDIIGKTETCSVRKFADMLLPCLDSYFLSKMFNAGETVRAMLKYGSAVQTYFNHNTANPADKDISFAAVDVTKSMLSDYKMKVSDADATLDFRGQVLSLNDTITTKLYFSGRKLEASDIKSVSGVDSANVSLNEAGYIEITGLEIGDLDKPITITVGNITISNFSAYSYIFSALSVSDESLKDVCAALYNYNEAAKKRLA